MWITTAAVTSAPGFCLITVALRLVSSFSDHSVKPCSAHCSDSKHHVPHSQRVFLHFETFFSPARPPVHFVAGYNVCFLQGFDCIEISRLLVFCEQHLDRGAKGTAVKTHFQRRQEGKQGRHGASRQAVTVKKKQRPSTSWELWCTFPKWPRPSTERHSKSSSCSPPFLRRKAEKTKSIWKNLVRSQTLNITTRVSCWPLPLQTLLWAVDFLNWFHFFFLFHFIPFYLFTFSFEQWTLSGLDITDTRHHNDSV